jgi:hypothetical protein
MTSEATPVCEVKVIVFVEEAPGTGAREKNWK